MVLDDQRLLQLAAAASGGEAALSPQGQLYPVGMAADRALRLAASALVGQRLDRGRRCGRGSQARFPAAEPLPVRPELDRLLEAAGSRWSGTPSQQVYAPRTWQAVE